jgi:hypothetical protein
MFIHLRKRAWSRLTQTARRLGPRLRDRHRCTYALDAEAGALETYLGAVAIAPEDFPLTPVRELAEHYLQHRFDLLGSGWRKNRHGVRCGGFEGIIYPAGPAVEADRDGRWLRSRVTPANLPEARRIWRLSDAEYVPIDWQLDIKSGYRWNDKSWSEDVPIGRTRGADIKLPWELGRMHHLVNLAWAYGLARQGSQGFREPEHYASEFRNQLLDFIATNPPRFGVQWRCTMDVGIRVANWLVAYDLFRGYGTSYDEAFRQVLARSVYEHARHIVDHLEWHPTHRGNHYLANIGGLIFAAAYLPSSPETDAWLAFALQELVQEVGYQFFEEGSNFEGSTFYHRLSAEIVAYATALTLGLPNERKQALRQASYRELQRSLRREPKTLVWCSSGQYGQTPFPECYFVRLERMAGFTRDISKPDGRAPQIGDNDSGRFLKISPRYERLAAAEAKSLYRNLDENDCDGSNVVYWNEVGSNHGHLLAAVGAIVPIRDVHDLRREDAVEFRVARRYCRPAEAITPSFRLQTRLSRPPTPAPHVIPTHDSGAWVWIWRRTGIGAGIRLCRYSTFGLYIYKSPRLYVAIRCGATTGPLTGHLHDDELSVELQIDGHDVFLDPGTYVYTPDPRARNAYRARYAHVSPWALGAGPDLSREGLFTLSSRPLLERLEAARDRFSATACRGAARAGLEVCLAPDELRIVMRFSGAVRPDTQPPKPLAPLPVSPGYGQVLRQSVPCWPIARSA